MFWCFHRFTFTIASLYPSAPAAEFTLAEDFVFCLFYFLFFFVIEASVLSGKDYYMIGCRSATRETHANKPHVSY